MEIHLFQNTNLSILITKKAKNKKNSLNDLRMKTGMPLGPVDLDEFSLSIIFAISSGWVGERKNDPSYNNQ